MDPITINAATAVATWTWENFGKDFIGKLTKAGKDKWSNFQKQQGWQKGIEVYYQALHRDHKHHPCFGYVYAHPPG